MDDGRSMRAVKSSEGPGFWKGKEKEDAMSPRLCSGNAQDQKDGESSLIVLLLAERTRSECARSTRTLEDRLGYPLASGGTREEVQASTFRQVDWIVPEE